MKRVAAFLMLVLFAGACGDHGAEITDNGAKLLHAQIASARGAAAEGDYARARAELRQVETTVNELRTREWVTDRRAAAILAAVGATEDALSRYSTTPTTTAPVVTQSSDPPVTVAPAPASNDDGRGNGKVDGKRKGKKND